MGRQRLSRRGYCTALGTTVALGGLAGCLGSEDEYPSDPIEIVIPMDPGGGNDPYARALMDPLSDELGVDVNVVNEPPPTQRYPEIFQQDTDGYAITFHDGSPFIPLLYEEGFDNPFNPDSWYGLGSPRIGPMAVMFSTESGVESWEDAVEMSEEEDVEFNAAEVGGGIVHYDFMEELTGIQFNKIGGYDGTGQVVADMERGNVDAYFSPALTQLSPIQDGISRPVIVGDRDLVSDQVLSTYEEEGYTDVPSLDEVGLEDIIPISLTFNAIVAPPDVEEDRLETLREAVWNALTTDEYAQAVEEQGLMVDPQSPEDLREHLDAFDQTVRDFE